MNKKGFTLMELLAVILILAVVSVSSTIAFGNIDDTTAKTELKNKYIEIQRAASLYVDLNDDQPYIHEFSNKGITRITVNELKNNNYISDLSDPLSGGDIPLSYTVVIYLTDDKHIDTCIIESEYETDATGNAIETKHCVANSKGEFENVVCCNNKY